MITLAICYGQDIHYSNNNENLFNLNPANTTQISNAAFHMNYRNQWPGSADFVNYSAAYFNTFRSLKSTVGVQIIRDDQGKGTINTTGFSLFYGYRTKLADNLLLSSGIAGSYNLYSVNFDHLRFENNIVPVTLENSRHNYADFAVGLELGLFDLNWFGIAISHITKPQVFSDNKLLRKYTLNYRGNYSLLNHYSFRKITIEPLILTSIQTYSSEILYGGRVNIDGLIGGLYLRDDFQFNFDSFIIMLGICFRNISFIYTYDINLSGAQSRFNKLASHEVTFFYNLEYNIRRNKKGAIKCPKF